MSRKTRRLYLVLVSLVLLGGAVALVLAALRQDIVFFLSPTEVAAKPPAPGRAIRIGGLVERGSLRKLGSDGAVLFEVTDLSKSVKVRYRGILPDLFREGQGVVIEGAVNEQGEFIAKEVLAKHDEKYLPPEVAKALKASGRWQESGDQTGSDSPGGNSTGNNEGSGPR
ncbi:cytochrome c maturation protein CcmE [Dongia soli]|uniref:Cytochrome c-type biogenesis protein CcmE n=1 Tax=Dongia soli TaxID=600628 RepID=A0ABU5EHS0_9PROT|nr:cytochrome c maturation protein CcmE [Dongia soli]MDY0885901.1 cytochrome c maturation protein CcmE [Dongia soli]